MPRKIFPLKLNEDEKAELFDLASKEKLHASEYLRNIIRNQERVFTLSEDEVKYLKSEFRNLGLLGSNINQIAYHLNSNDAQYYRSGIPEDLLDHTRVSMQKALDQVKMVQESISSLIINHSKK